MTERFEKFAPEIRKMGKKIGLFELIEKFIFLIIIFTLSFFFCGFVP